MQEEVVKVKLGKPNQMVVLEDDFSMYRVILPYVLFVPQSEHLEKLYSACGSVPLGTNWKYESLFYQLM